MEPINKSKILRQGSLLFVAKVTTAEGAMNANTARRADAKVTGISPTTKNPVWALVKVDF